jgi:hypothetical protein
MMQLPAGQGAREESASCDSESVDLGGARIIEIDPAGFLEHPITSLP